MNTIRIVIATGMVVALSGGKGSVYAADGNPGLELVEVRKIWDAAPHNAFTDLIRFKDRWYCMLREGSGHAARDGSIRVLASADGDHWESVKLFENPENDLRDGKLSITPDGRLMIHSYIWFNKQVNDHRSQSWVSFSEDGQSWTEPLLVGERNFWIWGAQWQGDAAYGVGYGRPPGVSAEEGTLTRLYRSTDGKQWDVWVENLFPKRGNPNEGSLVFAADGTCYCLLRRNAGSAQLGKSQPPYKEWNWRDTDAGIGGPKIIQLPDGRLLASMRLYDGGKRTSLCWIDSQTGKLTEALKLKNTVGAGDTGYPGMVLHDHVLWVSYYSGDKAKSSIYLARIQINEASR